LIALERGFLDSILDRVIVEPFTWLAGLLTRLDEWLCLPRLRRAPAAVGDAVPPARPPAALEEGNQDE
jgi:hypothetical protein